MKELTAVLTGLSMENPLLAALLVSLYAALTTTLGGILVVLARKAREGRLEALLDVGMGFSSGVMIVASFTSLLLPAIDLAGLPTSLAGFTLGALLIHVVNKLSPHEHLVRGYEGPESLRRKIKAAWLVAIAVIIHNLPEGMAIGASTAYSIPLGIATGLAIGLQDFPEGLAVSLPVYASTGSFKLAVALGALSGLSEVATALIAVLAAGGGAVTLALVLAFAAGAMVYVVSHEALPESHRSGHEAHATLGFFIGFLVMLSLDVALS